VPGRRLKPSLWIITLLFEAHPAFGPAGYKNVPGLGKIYGKDPIPYRRQVTELEL